MKKSDRNNTMLENQLSRGIWDGLNNLDGLDEVNEIHTKLIDLDKLVINPKNFYSKENISELADQIRNDGLLHNLVVKPLHKR